RHLAAAHADLDVRGVDLVVIGQRLADQLADPLVGALVARGALAAVRAGAAVNVDLAGGAARRVPGAPRAGVAVRTGRIADPLVAAPASIGVARALFVAPRQ